MTQPEALRLANELLTDRALECFDWAHDAGYELRRLYEVNQMLVKALEKAVETTYSDYLESEWKLLLTKAKEKNT